VKGKLHQPLSDCCSVVLFLSTSSIFFAIIVYLMDYNVEKKESKDQFGKLIILVTTKGKKNYFRYGS